MPSKKPQNASVSTHKEVGDGTRELKEESVDFGMTSGTTLVSVIWNTLERKKSTHPILKGQSYKML